jgi:hypothetical protein
MGNDWPQTRASRCLPAALSARICKLLQRRRTASPSGLRSDENLRILGCGPRGDALALVSTPTPRAYAPLNQRLHGTTEWATDYACSLDGTSPMSRPLPWGRYLDTRRAKYILSTVSLHCNSISFSLFASTTRSGICLYRHIICLILRPSTLHQLLPFTLHHHGFLRKERLAGAYHGPSP